MSYSFVINVLRPMNDYTVRGWPIGTEFSTIVPERIEYWAPDVVQPAYVWTRKALACEWSAPRPKVQGPEPAPDPSLNLFEQMFGCSWKD